VDFRPLNKYVIREPFHQAPAFEIVQRITADDAEYFSTVDATGSYNQCGLSPESRDYTTFITPYGRYRYKRAPYGIASISDHFNRRMSELLAGLPCMVRVVDDTLVYGRTEEDHAIHVIKVLQSVVNVRLDLMKRNSCSRKKKFPSLD
jgi:hypothetical protein